MDSRWYLVVIELAFAHRRMDVSSVKQCATSAYSLWNSIVRLSCIGGAFLAVLHHAVMLFEPGHIV